MPIKDPIQFITVEDFKASKYWNSLLFDEQTAPDNDIWLAINQATDAVNYVSGNNISSKWPEITPTEFTDTVQTATAHQVRFLLGKGVDYMRAQASISQGGITYQQQNPNDPFYVVPEVYMELSKINERLTFQGFNMNVSPRCGNNFLSPKNDNYTDNYIRITNLLSNDPRTKIIKTNPSGIVGSIITIDTTDITSTKKLTPGNGINIDNNIISTYFISDNPYISIWYNPDNSILMQPRTGENEQLAIDLFNNNEYSELKTPTKSIIGGINDIQDLTNSAIDDIQALELKKQDKLNTTSDIIINDNNPIVNKSSDGTVSNTLLIKNMYGQLTTTDKTIVGAINELKNDGRYYNTGISNNYKALVAIIDILSNNTELNTIAKDYTDAINEIDQKVTTGVTVPSDDPILTLTGINLSTKDKIDNYVNTLIKTYHANMWKSVGTLNGDKTMITYEFIENKTYKVTYNFVPGINSSASLIKEFKIIPTSAPMINTLLDTCTIFNSNEKFQLVINKDNNIIEVTASDTAVPQIYELYEYQY